MDLEVFFSFTENIATFEIAEVAGALSTYKGRGGSRDLRGFNALRVF